MKRSRRGGGFRFRPDRAPQGRILRLYEAGTLVIDSRIPQERDPGDDWDADHPCSLIRPHRESRCGNMKEKKRKQPRLHGKTVKIRINGEKIS